MLGYWVNGSACSSLYNFPNENSCKAITHIQNWRKFVDRYRMNVGMDTIL
jgi:hypothetical protein